MHLEPTPFYPEDKSSLEWRGADGNWPLTFKISKEIEEKLGRTTESNKTFIDGYRDWLELACRQAHVREGSIKISKRREGDYPSNRIVIEVTSEDTRLLVKPYKE